MRQLVVALSLLGCTTPTDSPTPAGSAGDGKADSSLGLTTGPVRFVDSHVADVVVRAGCAAAGGSTRVGAYAVQGFSASAMLASIKAEDAKRGCKGRVYSASKPAAVAAVDKFLTSEPAY